MLHVFVAFFILGYLYKLILFYICLMTVQEIINWFSNNSSVIINYYVALLVISLLGMLVLNKVNFKPPINYFYTVLVYGAVVPGLLSVVLILYGLFFAHQNLLEVNVMSYYLPVVAMVLLLFIVNKTVPLKKVPGFGKLSGLFVMIFIAFIVTYVLQRMVFGVFFIGSFSSLIILFLVLLFILKVAWDKIIN